MADERIVQAMKIVDPTTTSQQAAVDASGNLQVDIAAASVTVTVDNGGTFAVQEDGAALTALQLIDDMIYTDDTDTHATGTSKGSLMMAAATPTDSAVDANDIGALSMSLDRRLLVDADIGNTVTVTDDGSFTLAANSGVDIGDVDVTSVIPGTGATNLGKAEDAAHASGDTGVMFLGVRNDSNATAFGSADGDYVPIAVDNNGNLQVDVLTGGGTDTPTNPTVVTANTTNTAAGSDSGTTIQTSDLGGATYSLARATATASVAFKAQLQYVDDDSATLLETQFGEAGTTVIFQPTHRDYFTHTFTANAGFDGFRIVVTNLDTSEAADLYGSFNYED